MQQKFKLYLTPSFNKSFKKIAKKNQKVINQVNKTLMLLRENPFYNSLNSHKVESVKYGLCPSSRVTGDLRVLWERSKTEVQILDILDIGGHSGKNKVYK